MRIVLLICGYLTFSGTAVAQLFVDASDLLPNVGALGQSMDVQAKDIDGDGDLDIVLANEFQANTLLVNNYPNGFTKSSQPNWNAVVNDSEDVVISDFNQDGQPDVLFCSEDDSVMGESNVHELYMGNSNGIFERSNFLLPDTEANAVILMDVNKDGLDDVLLGNNGPITCLINLGDGTFSEESNRFPAIQRTTQDLLAVDVDKDNDLDVIEGNENGNVLYRNLGDGTFEDKSDFLPQLNIETRKVSHGDFDDDGDEDLFLSNVEFITGKERQNRLFENDGHGNFTDVTIARLPIDNDHSVDGIFEDVDQDGDPDLIIANIFGTANRIYLNDDGIFSDRTFEVLGELYTMNALGVIFKDLNNDGHKDIYICDRNLGQGTKDLLLLNKQTTAIHQIDLPVAKIYPNPATESIHIATSENLSAAKLVSTNGETVLDVLLDGTKDPSIKLGNTASGNYILVLLRGKTIVHKQMVFVQRD